MGCILNTLIVILDVLFDFMRVLSLHGDHDVVDAVALKVFQLVADQRLIDYWYNC